MLLLILFGELSYGLSSLFAIAAFTVMLYEPTKTPIVPTNDDNNYGIFPGSREPTRTPIVPKNDDNNYGIYYDKFYGYDVTAILLCIEDPNKYLPTQCETWYNLCV